MLCNKLGHNFLKQEIEHDHYGTYIDRVLSKNLLLKRTCEKNPTVICAMLKKAKELDRGSKTLEKIIERIVALRGEGKIYKDMRLPILSDVLEDAEEGRIVQHSAFAQTDAL